MATTRLDFRHVWGAPLKAFLSHSSKDKIFVNSVATSLGLMQIELDEKTFDFTLNVAAIHDALKRCDLFVYFLSRDSSTSGFVKEELRSALENRGSGLIKRIVVSTLDESSYRDLPNWLQQLNIAQKISSPKLCARRIQALLLELAALDDAGVGLFIGRDADQADLRKAVSVPPKDIPLSIHAVGQYGIGRRTFITNSLKSLFPRLFNTFIEVTISQYDGPEEFYRQLFILNTISSFENTIGAFELYARLDTREKASAICTILQEMADNGEFIIVIDEGGVYDDDGQFQPFLAETMRQLSALGRPALGFVQARMMPAKWKLVNERSYHRYLKPLRDEDMKTILSLTLNEFSIEYTEAQLLQLISHLDGHPYNIRFLLHYVLNYGVQSLIDDPQDLVEWKNRRAADFLNKIVFDSDEVKIMSILSEYHYLDPETLLATVGGSLEQITGAIRRLQDFCCLERREHYLYIPGPLRDGVRRDDRFKQPDSWNQDVALKICELVSEYENEDHVPLAIIGSATLASAKAKNPPAFLARLILPSHLLRIAREHYDEGRRTLCMEFCQKAYAMKDRLPDDAQVEVLRLWGLSAIRAGDTTVYEDVLGKLRGYHTKVARRMVFFLEGFALRLKGQLDLAEDKFIQAWKLARSNQSINRELASLYCKQRRYAEAEAHARAAFETAPTNPFIIDIFAETLLGKAAAGLAIDQRELDEIMKQLEVYGDAPGSSFFLVREAQSRLRKRDYINAIKAATKAIDRTPQLLAPYFLRAEVYLAQADPVRAEKDLQQVDRILTEAGGFSEGDEARAHELGVRIMIERRQFNLAKDKIDLNAFLPRAVKNRLYRQLAKAVAFEPDHASKPLKEWARRWQD
ncbi:TIR domain-containing protein [Mesorhizobium sp. WSM4989]|nr:TIR domain-containing protein [Mesorhizobium sp. WSM4989]MDG4899189.1 hypothetical protein [Mesorhizobium sp. WSM4962]MDG4918574.1 hypothetical protein [Mesorhizobium sp. WSM4989]